MLHRAAFLRQKHSCAEKAEHRKGQGRTITLDLRGSASTTSSMEAPANRNASTAPQNPEGCQEVEFAELGERVLKNLWQLLEHPSHPDPGRTVEISTVLQAFLNPPGLRKMLCSLL